MKRFIWLLLISTAFAQNWSKWNNVTVGSTAGNIGKWNNVTIGTTAGNIGKWNTLISPGGAGPHTDSFDFNSATSGQAVPNDGLSNWDDLSGGFGAATVAGTSPNQVITGGFTFDATGAARWKTSVWAYNSNQTSEIVLTNMSGSSGFNILAASCRNDTTTGNSRTAYLAVVVDDAVSGGSHTTRLEKYVSGTGPTTLLANQSITWTNGDKLGIDCRGTTIRVLKNGSTAGTMSATDSAIPIVGQTSYQPGFVSHNGGAGTGGITGGAWDASE